jgi:hypothetical protein
VLEKIPTEYDLEMKEKKVAFAQTLTWITWSGNGNLFTSWPNHKEIVLWYEDDFFKNNTWMRGGKPHWAYNFPDSVIKEKNRDAIEWTPNTIESKVRINENKASIELTSDTTNLKEYQMRVEPSAIWEKVKNKLELKLDAKKQEYFFRAVNVANVAGSEHKVVIEQF